MGGCQINYPEGPWTGTKFSYGHLPEIDIKKLHKEGLLKFEQVEQSPCLKDVFFSKEAYEDIMNWGVMEKEFIEKVRGSVWEIGTKFNVGGKLIDTVSIHTMIPMLTLSSETPSCTCPSFNLAWLGCKCGYIQWERENAGK